MDLEKEYAELCQRLEVAEAEAARLSAQVAGLRAEKEQLAEALRRRQRPPAPVAGHDLTRLSRTDAMLAILEARGEAMTIPELLGALAASGRTNDSYRVVAPTLQQLLRSGRVERPARGQYTVADGLAGTPVPAASLRPSNPDPASLAQRAPGERPTCRTEILEAIEAILPRSDDDHFTVEEVGAEMARRGTRYSPATISTHIRSRMCVNAPNHHAVTYDDLERVRPGVYRLRRGHGRGAA